MTDVLRWGGARFLERGLRRHGTAALGLAAVAGAAGSVYCGVEALHYQRTAVAERAAAQVAIAELRDQLGGAKQALSAAQERLGDVKEQARDKVAASEQAVSSNADRIAQLTRKLDQGQRALRLAEAQRATLMARLSRSEVEAAQDQARQQEGMRGDLEQLEKKLRQLAAEREKIESERSKAEAERDRLRARVGQLEQKLSLRNRQPIAPLASAHSAPAAPSAPPPAAEPRVASLPPLRVAAETPVAATPPVLAAAVAVTPVPASAVAATPVLSPAVAVVPVSTASVAATPVAASLPAPVAAPPVASTTAAAVPAQPIAVAQPAVAAVATAPAAAPSVAYASAAPQPQRPAAAPAAVPAVARGAIAQVERVLGSAGVDVKNLFAQFGVNRGLGGPYIPNPRGVQPEQLSAEKLDALSRMVKSLPVAAPLYSYEIGSRFGVRGDPMNAHTALHTGVDLRAPYMSPVYATAAGVVTFSGYRADYGKIVEIDHGHGLVTRYAHLNRATVSVGQRVAAQTQVGFLGSTGRATGPHVHYEIVVNGEPQDPEKFMALGRVVPVVAQR